ncbi:ABC transporter substrate binding protein [Clostridium acetireducens DSM 10703]|uniref:ABC transporter substrate binding protein n=1 Tax=Clostridium acetireducens DSM 10703 TaxID=1121290 RepID=A0A1E8F023_9CLOT|nr:ABC transporter substrate-binding protein [Clostridium acetireducens]OFI06722.1 ABC transporter substrate binding protein [Clostridium acetireducens DSM 10703]
MVAKKKVTFLMSCLLTLSLFGGCASNNKDISKKKFKIGISQIVEHPALDASRKGFLDGLKSKGFEEGKNLEIDYQNSQGDIPAAQTIAQKFVSEKDDLIFAISTPSSQAAFNTTKDIPIVITAVTDPVKAGIVKSLDKPSTNVTGSIDKVPIENQFKLIKELLPSAKNIGILYNTSEANSDVQIKEAKQFAPQFGLNIITSGITTTNDIPQSLNAIINKIDALYVPTDNMVVSSLSLISNKCNEKNIPIIGAEKAHVESGALITNGIDYYDLGVETGILASEILKGKKPTEIPIHTVKNTKIFINESALKKLNIKIPENILSKAEKVKGGLK